MTATTAAAQQLGQAAAPELRKAAVQGASGDLVPGEVIVRFEPGTTASERLDVRRAAGVDFDESLKLPRAQLVEVEGGVAAAVERLERRPEVAYAQPNYRYRAVAASAPNDTFFGSLWGLSGPALPDPGVDALEAWEAEPTRGAGQVVAVVDSGVAADHPDLIGRLWSNPDDPPGGGDQDGNGKVDDVAGYDFVDEDTDPDDYNFHGTHVAGTIAATAGNGRGVAGVAPAATIMPVRVLDGDGSGSSVGVGEGIAYAAREGADVINLSLGGPVDESDQFTSDAIDEANDLDAVIVAAAGNDGSNNDAAPTSPCTLPQPNLICVAAVNRSGGLASFSNYGATTVDLGAPGTSILSTQTSYGAIYAENFATPGDWLTGTSNGGVPWGLVASPTSDGNPSVADSPSGNYGAANDPEFYAESVLIKDSALDLTGERGCRMHFDMSRALEPDFDYVSVGAAPRDPEEDTFLTGSTGGSFRAEEVSISDLDGSSAVRPRFTLLSDGLDERDGVYVDDLRVLCRQLPAGDGTYVAFAGTSMAAPHVAGVAALVSAADPGAPDTEVVQALKQGTSPLAALACKTVTGGVADADAAIAAVLALPGGSGSAPDGCPAPPPTPPTPLPQPPPPGAPNLAPAQGPSISLAGARSAIRVSRRGRFGYVFKATPGLAGQAVFRTRRKAFVSRRAHVTVARKRFSVLGSGPSALTVVKARLSRRKLAILRRNGRLLLLVSVTARDSAGRTARATKALTLKAPRR
ncbi:MAG TPA: S8 family serine peptidase [Thermoleophilaceae bacterium]|nr:S8 family serine peptidase [Thermoleophilaceae bacterium]